MKRLFIIFLLPLLFGCGPDIILSCQPVGQIKSARTLSLESDTLSNTHAKYKDIVTDQMVVTVLEDEPILIGRQAFLKTSKSGIVYFTWEGAYLMYPVCKK